MPADRRLERNYACLLTHHSTFAVASLSPATGQRVPHKRKYVPAFYEGAYQDAATPSPVWESQRSRPTCQISALLREGLARRCAASGLEKDGLSNLKGRIGQPVRSPGPTSQS